MAKQADFFGDCTSDYAPEHFFTAFPHYKYSLTVFMCLMFIFYTKPSESSLCNNLYQEVSFENISTFGCSNTAF